MDGPDALELATAYRGDIAEARYRGHVAVVAADGTVLGAIGDPATVTALRSCVKPLQALPFVRDAVDELGVTPDEIAVACASHNGEDIHVRAVATLLARAGLNEGALACGPQPPMGPTAARELIAAGLPARPIHNNCSGKHAGMLAACVVAGWTTEGYQRIDHPMQRSVAAAMDEYLGHHLSRAPVAVDGCGLPTYGVPLSALARGFAAAQTDAAFRRCQEAMAAHPMMVAGTGRFDTALLEDFGTAVTAKIGGAAVWVACARPAGPGVAVKLEGGVDSAVAPIALATLRSLGLLPDRVTPGLAAYARPVLRNWAGEPVGEIRVEKAAFAQLRSGGSSGGIPPTVL